MTNLKGMTLTQFYGLVEDMRKVYNFKDDETKIIETKDLITDAHTLLELYAHDEENDVDVRLSKGIKGW